MEPKVIQCPRCGNQMWDNNPCLNCGWMIGQDTSSRPQQYQQSPHNMQPQQPQVTQQVPQSTYTPPKNKTKGELFFGRNIVGIVAAVLMFISLICCAVAVAPMLNDVMKMCVILLVSAALTVTGFIYEHKRHSFPAQLILGSGMGCFFITIIVSELVFHIINPYICLLLLLIWAGFQSFLIWKTKSSVMSFIMILAMVALIWIPHPGTEHWMIIIARVLCLVLLIVSQKWAKYKAYYFAALLTSAATLTILLLTSCIMINFPTNELITKIECILYTIMLLPIAGLLMKYLKDNFSKPLATNICFNCCILLAAYIGCIGMFNGQYNWQYANLYMPTIIFGVYSFIYLIITARIFNGGKLFGDPNVNYVYLPIISILAINCLLDINMAEPYCYIMLACKCLILYILLIVLTRANRNASGTGVVVATTWTAVSLLVAVIVILLASGKFWAGLSVYVTCGILVLWIIRQLANKKQFSPSTGLAFLLIGEFSVLLLMYNRGEQHYSIITILILSIFLALNYMKEKGTISLKCIIPTNRDTLLINELCVVPVISCAVIIYRLTNIDLIEVIVTVCALSIFSLIVISQLLSPRQKVGKSLSVNGQSIMCVIMLTLLVFDIMQITNVNTILLLPRVITMLVALAFVIFGFKRNIKALRIYGLILALVMIMGIVLIDVPSNDLLIKSGALFVGAVVCFAISIGYNIMDKRLYRDEHEAKKLAKEQKAAQQTQQYPQQVPPAAPQPPVENQQYQVPQNAQQVQPNDVYNNNRS